MYTFILDLHSWLRWAVLGAAVVVLILSITGLLRGRDYGAKDRVAGSIWMIFFDLQFLLGLMLYFWLSPYLAAARAADAWIKDTNLRFWMLEHALGMFLAIVVLHIGRAIVKRSKGARRQHMVTLITAAVSLLLVVGSIPWPKSRVARPLFRLHTVGN